MSQNAERDRVKIRIRALAARTILNGCTEAEAFAAAEMVGRLLERYALTMAEIDIREEPCIQREVALTGRQRRPVDGCVPAIAAFCDCRVWLARKNDGRCYVFFGFEPDVILATYLYAVIDRSMTDEVLAFRGRSPQLRGQVLRSASLGFARGMASRLDERLIALRGSREASMATQQPTGTALMIVKASRVDEAFRAEQIRLVAGRGSVIRKDGAYRQGYVAGDRVNLDRPLTSARAALVEA